MRLVIPRVIRRMLLARKRPISKSCKISRAGTQARAQSLDVNRDV